MVPLEQSSKRADPAVMFPPEVFRNIMAMLDDRLLFSTSYRSACQVSKAWHAIASKFVWRSCSAHAFMRLSEECQSQYASQVESMTGFERCLDVHHVDGFFPNLKGVSIDYLEPQSLEAMRLLRPHLEVFRIDGGAVPAKEFRHLITTLRQARSIKLGEHASEAVNSDLFSILACRPGLETLETEVLFNTQKADIIVSSHNFRQHTCPLFPDVTKLYIRKMGDIALGLLAEAPKLKLLHLVIHRNNRGPRYWGSMKKTLGSFKTLKHLHLDMQAGRLHESVLEAIASLPRLRRLIFEAAREPGWTMVDTPAEEQQMIDLLFSRAPQLCSVRVLPNLTFDKLSISTGDLVSRDGTNVWVRRERDSEDVLKEIRRWWTSDQ